MKYFLLILVLLLPLTPLVAQEDLREQASNYFDEGNEDEALELYLQLLDEYPEDVEILWRTSMLYARVGNRIDDEEKRDEYLYHAVSISEKALETDDSVADVHFTYAVAMGRVANHASGSDALELAKKIRDHSQKALEIDPEHEGAMHVLGMWHMRMANLSMTERTAAYTLFGGVPEGAENDKAEEYLNKAIEFDPNMILYHLDLAKFYEMKDEQGKAKKLLEKIVHMEPRYKDDPEHKQEAQEMLAEL